MLPSECPSLPWAPALLLCLRAWSVRMKAENWETAHIGLPISHFTDGETSSEGQGLPGLVCRLLNFFLMPLGQWGGGLLTLQMEGFSWSPIGAWMPLPNPWLWPDC